MPKPGTRTNLMPAIALTKEMVESSGALKGAPGRTSVLCTHVLLTQMMRMLAYLGPVHPGRCETCCSADIQCCGQTVSTTPIASRPEHKDLGTAQPCFACHSSYKGFTGGRVLFLQHVQQGICKCGRAANPVPQGWAAHQRQAGGREAADGTKASQHGRPDCVQAPVCTVQDNCVHWGAS